MVNEKTVTTANVNDFCRSRNIELFYKFQRCGWCRLIPTYFTELFGLVNIFPMFMSVETYHFISVDLLWMHSIHRVISSNPTQIWHHSEQANQ
jgi:hypothetical protein